MMMFSAVLTAISSAIFSAGSAAYPASDKVDNSRLSALREQEIDADFKDDDADFGWLSPGISSLIDVLGFRESLLNLRSGGASANKNPLEKIMQKQELINRLLITSVELQAVLAEIDAETARTGGYQRELEQRRYKMVRRSTTATFATSGVLTGIAAAINLLTNFSTILGNAMQIAGSLVSTSFPFYQSYKVSKQTSELPAHPTMLCQLFDRPTDVRTKLPDGIWRYLNADAPWSKGYTRKEFLISRWISLNYFQVGTLAGNKKLDLLCGKAGGNQIFSHQDMCDRISMLTDLRALISLMNKDIVEMLCLVQS
jgi:hypothetical protein